MSQAQNYKTKHLTPLTKPNNEIIIFVHGLFRSYWSMYWLSRFFRKKGYDVYLYDYPSIRHNLKTHIEDFHHFLNECIQKHPHQKFHIVTHSMGGIITRGAVTKLHLEQYQQIDTIVMLVPPNQGSPYAQKLLQWIPKLPNLIKPLHDISSDERAHIHTLDHLNHPKIGIIAAKYDRKSPLTHVHLPTQRDLMVITTTHTLIIDMPQTKRAILQFIETGSFVA